MEGNSRKYQAKRIIDLSDSVTDIINERCSLGSCSTEFTIKCNISDDNLREVYYDSRDKYFKDDLIIDSVSRSNIVVCKTIEDGYRFCANKLIDIKRVIFSKKSKKTIVLFKDGTKVIVTAKNEKFDEEKGILVAIMRKILGKKSFDKYFKDLLETKVIKVSEKKSK